MLDRKVINSFSYQSYLYDHGIYLLSGEACALGMRGLYDLTEEGAEIIAEFFGGCVPTGDSWNGGAVKSAFLPYSVIPDLVAYILSGEWESVSHVTRLRGGPINFIVGSSHELMGEITAKADEYRTFRRRGSSASNTHVMSGRRQ